MNPIVSRYLAVICAIALGLLVCEGWAPALANPCGASPAPKTMSGTVKAVSADSLQVERGNKVWAFALNAAVAEMVQKLKVGDSVTVRYVEANGKRTAVTVTAKASKARE